MTTRTDVERALAALDAAMTAAVYPGQLQLAPGTTDDYISEVLAVTGLTVPDELRAVWRWHNGTRPLDANRPPDEPAGSHTLPGGHTLYSVEAAARWWAWTRDNYPWDQLDTIEPDWLPIGHEGPGTLWVDCSGPPSAPAAVYVERSGDDSERGEVEARKVASVARLVDLWRIALEQGSWHVIRPGDSVTAPDGRTYALRISRPMWHLNLDDPALPDDWPG